MNDASALKNQLQLSTGMLVLLQLITLGIYPVIWLYKHMKVVNEIVGAEMISEMFLTVQIILTILNLICLFSGFGGLFGLIAGIIWIVWAFKARTILVNYAAKQLNVDLRTNGVWVFFFTLFYINYCINDLPNVASRQTALRAA